MKEWDSVHNHFDLAEFYDHLVRIMKDNADSDWYLDLVRRLTQ